MTANSVAAMVGVVAHRPFHTDTLGPMMLLGIDPGVTGALVFYETNGPQAFVYDMPTMTITRNKTERRVVDIYGLDPIIALFDVRHVFIELVGAAPKQGIASAFSFGVSTGVVKGVIGTLGLPHTEVAPTVWKLALRVPASKDGARARATALFPSFRHHWPKAADHGRAEALLIAHWGFVVGLKTGDA